MPPRNEVYSIHSFDINLETIVAAFGKVSDIESSKHSGQLQINHG